MVITPPPLASDTPHLLCIFPILSSTLLYGWLAPRRRTIFYSVPAKQYIKPCPVSQIGQIDIIMLQVSKDYFFFHLQDKEANIEQICEEFNRKIFAIQQLISKVEEKWKLIIYH